MIHHLESFTLEQDNNFETILLNKTSLSFVNLKQIMKTIPSSKEVHMQANGLSGITPLAEMGVQGDTFIHFLNILECCCN